MNFLLFSVLFTAGPLSGSDEPLCKHSGTFDLPELFKDGDVVLGGIFNMHSDKLESIPSYTFSPKEARCKSFDIGDFRLVQTMIFTIEEINRDRLLLPNISLGYRIYDDCASPRIATKAALALANGQEEDIASPNCRGSPPVPAVIGSDGSSETISVARTLGPFNIPVVSHYSTCACLSNRQEYRTFFRTIPSDYHQSKLLVRLVSTFGWTWIGTISSNNDYGHFGMQAFMEDAAQLGICIAFSESFYRTDPTDKITEIVGVIKMANTKVVVAFVSSGDMRVLLTEVVRQNVTGVQWIGSEAWVTENLLPPRESARFLVGAIGATVRRAEITGLQDFLLKVRPSMSPGSTLLNEFWEATFRCRFRPENTTAENNQMRQCTGNENLNQINNKYSDLTVDGGSYNVYKAVYSVAHALQNLNTCEQGKGPFKNNSCADISNFEPWQLLHYMYSVNFTTNTGDKIYFDANGDSVATYDVINWQRNAQGLAEITRVGYYDGSAPTGQELFLNEKAIVWNQGKGKVPVAICSENCLPGTRKVIRVGQPICCFDCSPCADGEISNTTDSINCFRCSLDYWSNEVKDQCVPKKVEFLTFGDTLGVVLLTLALIGFSTTTAIAVVFFKYKDTPIVKANNSELSFLLLFAIMLCFLCSVTFIGQSSDWSCMLQQTAFGISFVFSISCVLVKTILVLAAFKSTVPTNNMRRWFGPTQQRLSVFILTCVQGLICAVWLTTSPPFPLRNTEYYRDIVILECDHGSVIAFFAFCSYIALLSSTCFVFAFLARNLPDNFNEAKFITFSMLIFYAVWITFIPAYISSPGKYAVAVEVFAILASSSGLLVCIFAPKCYIILLKPENNTRKCVMDRTR
ncbi:extracellular calcium-sensing receptor-like [Heptranchias perlo]|uniref:extracellular calcium-sensing receptor-like n=1 Tax=Heptranchias perlo TaxID=212740 RepID=UPI00355A9072